MKDFDEVMDTLSPEDRKVIEDYIENKEDFYYDLGKETGYANASEDY